MKRNLEIKELFLKHFDKPVTELKFSNLYELLVCVMLSAQCTDKRVNQLTSSLLIFLKLILISNPLQMQIYQVLKPIYKLVHFLIIKHKIL